MGTNGNAGQAAQYLEQGIDAFRNFGSLVSGGEVDTDVAEELALLSETEAVSRADDIQDAAEDAASRLREEREKQRATANTEWGGSGLAMSGSKKLVRDAARIQDKQDEDDLLFEGDQEARDVLNQARHDANIARITAGTSPLRSTLSLGSKIYHSRS